MGGAPECRAAGADHRLIIAILMGHRQMLNMRWWPVIPGNGASPALKVADLWLTVPSMDPWRLGLLIAAAVFLLFLLSKLRPRLPGREAPSQQPKTRSDRRELKVWRQLQRLPRSAQKRVQQRLQNLLTPPDGEDDR